MNPDTDPDHFFVVDSSELKECKQFFEIFSTPVGKSWFYEQYEKAKEKSSFEDEYCCHPKVETKSWAESLLAKDREFKEKINEKKADEIELALSTPESRAALLKAMVEFKSFDFQSIGRKLFMVDELPQGAYARYENNVDAIADAFSLLSIDFVTDPVDPACRIKKEDDPAVCAPCFPLFVSTSMREDEETTISELMMRDI